MKGLHKQSYSDGRNFPLWRWIYMFLHLIKRHFKWLSKPKKNHDDLHASPWHSKWAWVWKEEKKRNLPGQAFVLQTTDWKDGPWHFFPPLADAGLSHFRLLYLNPPPQVTEHFPYMPHWDHWPSTKYENMTYFINFRNNCLLKQNTLKVPSQ